MCFSTPKYKYTYCCFTTNHVYMVYELGHASSKGNVPQQKTKPLFGYNPARIRTRVLEMFS